MLIYHPAYDLNHSLFRALMILENSEHSELQLDLFRIIDFYTLFPHLIKFIKPFPTELKNYKKLLKDIPEPYERIGNLKRIMFELEAIQTTALQNLLAKGFINIEAYNIKKLRRSDLELPSKLLDDITNNEIARSGWFQMLVNNLTDVTIKGKAGLKSRTGLMEYRYDLEKS